MKTSIITDIFSKASAALSTHARPILTILQISADTAAVIYGVCITPGVVRKIDAENAQRERDRIPPMTRGEVVKLCWPYYVPSAGLLLAGAGLSILSLKLADRKIAAIGALYTATEKALGEYQAKTMEIVGERKERRIRDEIAIDRVNANPASQQQIFITGSGDYLCYETWNGTYFRSNIDDVRRAILDGRDELTSNPFGFLSVNELRSYMKLPAVTSGYDIGWNENDRLTITTTSMLSDNGEPCLAFTYSPDPHPDKR